MIIGFKCEPEDTNRHNPNHTRGKYPRIEWPIHHEEHNRIYDSHRDHETLQRINGAGLDWGQGSRSGTPIATQVSPSRRICNGSVRGTPTTTLASRDRRICCHASCNLSSCKGFPDGNKTADRGAFIWHMLIDVIITFSLSDIKRLIFVYREDSLGSATTSLVYYYGSAKSSLPPNVKDLLNSSEEKASIVLRPIGSALQQVYIIIEGIGKNVGLNPSDPIVQLAVLLGGSTTIGISYWLFAYGGYSGDLSPESTLELLKSDGKADLRVKDGIPDLRRAARSKYASVASPEIKGPTKKLLKGGNEVDDALVAVVIRNLKLVKGDSKVIIMDANGTRSKSIARLLKKLGGFQSWAKNLRVKELKPETALTVINEDAEEILEGIKPTPTLVFGSLLGLSAVTYALLEWETTLQYIGVLSLGLTIYLRFSTYEGSEDFLQDLKLLLSPLRVGAEAFSWAAKKLEPNKIGLATSPSTTAVQDRVLKAAAKHESKPSDAEESTKTDSFASEA
ncbi:unnamed protein product [Triticum turgidum subsp. durum]|uniref:Rhodanese domain-containing protein n=1 Tax=Triticum turgidum subsp. durum TaxID=4567 RepID=A0A9R0RW31_TRITD|nr:unnamed protein product [Triticum turgidum subsp. durum]